jgi:hypothetical protein
LQKCRKKFKISRNSRKNIVPSIKSRLNRNIFTRPNEAPNLPKTPCFLVKLLYNQLFPERPKNGFANVKILF